MNYPASDRDNFTPEHPNLDILGEQAAFLQDVATLIAELPGVQQPVTENHSFIFALLPLSTPYELPKDLRAVSDTIDDITVHIGDAHIPETDQDVDRPSHISVDITAGPDIYTFSSTGMGDSEKPFDLLKIRLDNYSHREIEERFGPRTQRIGSVNRAELNTLIMSIALPNSLGDYSAYDDKDLQTSQAFESLKELLSDRAYAQNEFYAFSLRGGEADIRFTKEAGNITSFTLTYFDDKRNIPMLVEYDADTEVRLGFFRSEDDGKHIIIPTAQEIHYVRQLLRSELNALGTRHLTDQDQTIVDERDQITQDKIVSNELTASVDGILNELGLNPPDTSA